MTPDLTPGGLIRVNPIELPVARNLLPLFLVNCAPTCYCSRLVPSLFRRFFFSTFATGIAVFNINKATADDLPQPASVINIWNGPAPGVPENPGEEKQEPMGRVSHVSVPTLDVYPADPAKANGTAFIVCSGGGYTRLAARPLGQYAAQKFVPLGITVFSLKYRVRPPSTNVVADALADGQRALRLIRNRAKEWHIDPNRIGMIGWSAGTNLIVNACAHSDAGDPNATDPIARESSRPDFVGLFATWGIRASTLKIDATYPPAFIDHASDDKTAPVAYAEELAAAWKAAGRPVQFQLYDKGGHEAFNFPNSLSQEWPDKFLAWLRDQKLLDAPKGN